MAADAEFDHSGRYTRAFDAETGWCTCRVCLTLPLYVGHKGHAPTSLTHDPDPQDTLGCVSTDPVPDAHGWELGGEGG